MVKTPEEIKKGLECCQFSFTSSTRCRMCPYQIMCLAARPRKVLIDDTLAIIQQLERERDELLHKNQQLQRERDAAANAMKEFAARINSGEDVSACEYCKKEFSVCNCNCLKEFEFRGAKEGK